MGYSHRSAQAIAEKASFDVDFDPASLSIRKYDQSRFLPPCSIVMFPPQYVGMVISGKRPTYPNRLFPSPQELPQDKTKCLFYYLDMSRRFDQKKFESCVLVDERSLKKSEDELHELRFVMTPFHNAMERLWPFIRRVEPRDLVWSDTEILMRMHAQLMRLLFGEYQEPGSGFGGN